jgi:hypothetical protein
MRALLDGTYPLSWSRQVSASNLIPFAPKRRRFFAGNLLSGLSGREQHGQKRCTLRHGFCDDVLVG